MEAGVREPFINGDSEQLKQVFFNIIGNSIDALNEGPKSAYWKKIRREFVYIKVQDHGANQ